MNNEQKLIAAGFIPQERKQLEEPMYCIFDADKTWVLDVWLIHNNLSPYAMLWCNDVENDLGHLPLETVLTLAGALFPQKKS